MSKKHFQKYIDEFLGHHNIRNADTVDQMGVITGNMSGKELRYADLIQDNGLPSGARL